LIDSFILRSLLLRISFA